MDMENVDEDTVFGVGEIGQFTWKQMLDFATCTECGRCQSACPAWTTDKPLSPKLLVMNLRDNMFATAGPLLSGEGEHRFSGDGSAADPSRMRHDRAEAHCLANLRGALSQRGASGVEKLIRRLQASRGIRGVPLARART